MTIPITAHASSHNLTQHASATANRRSTKANDEHNSAPPETSLHPRNDHQRAWRKVEEITTQDKPLSSRTGTSLEEAKASHLANDNMHRVLSKGIVSFVARQATVPLIVLNVVAFRLCLHSHNNQLRITTLSRETECWAAHHWL